MGIMYLSLNYEPDGKRGARARRKRPANLQEMRLAVAVFPLAAKRT